MLSISQRLLEIAAYIPKGAALADIGSDHAMLPVYLALQQRLRLAIAGEVNDGPYESARRQIAKYELHPLIEARKGNGLEVVRSGEVDTVVIAGMGGPLICRILETGKAKLEQVDRLILQPNIGESQVREWLLKEGWCLIDESIIKEDGKIYEVLCAVTPRLIQTTNEEIYAVRRLNCGVSVDRQDQIKMGPYLLSQGNETFIEKWNYEIGKLQRVIEHLQQSDLPSAIEKKAGFQQELARLKEVIQCLQKDRR